MDSWGSPSHCGPATLGLGAHQDLKAWGLPSSGEALETGSWGLQMTVLGPDRTGRGTGSVGLVVCGLLQGMCYTGYTCPVGPGAPRTGVLAAADHCRVRCIFHPHGAWLEDHTPHLQDACSSVRRQNSALCVTTESYSNFKNQCLHLFNRISAQIGMSTFNTKKR